MENMVCMYCGERETTFVNEVHDVCEDCFSQLHSFYNNNDLDSSDSKIIRDILESKE